MNEQPNEQRSVRNIGLRLLFITIALSPLAYSIYREWSQLLEALREVNWLTFSIGQLLLLPIMLLVGTIPWASLHHLGIQFSYAKATKIYFFTQILKYLPGGFWAFPGRMTVYRLLGVDRAKAIVSVFRETTAVFLGAAAIGVLGLLGGLPLSKTLTNAIGFGILASGFAIFLTQLPWFWRMLSSFRLFKTSALTAYAEVDTQEINLAWLPPALLGSMAFYLLFGIPFRQIAIAVYPNATTLTWLEATSIFALAWCAGFVVVIVPAGIGVRESALVFLLANVMPVGAALSLALLARLIWVLAEGFWILMAMVWFGKETELSWEAIRQFGE
jgi:hypothetical protein